jgi:hypothetical protein
MGAFKSNKVGSAKVRPIQYFAKSQLFGAPQRKFLLLFHHFTTAISNSGRPDGWGLDHKPPAIRTVDDKPR